MSVAIKVENLSKLYLLGSNRKPDHLRQAISDAVSAAWRRLRTLPVPEAGPSNEFWALKKVSFDVEEHEIVGIIGRNGAGKSTLLKVLSKITEPTRGRVQIRGRVASLLEVGTGFHPELSGKENIYLSGVIMGMRRAEITKKLDEIVDFADIERFLDTPVKRYSSGMYVRLAFAVAAHLDMEILLVDEVLAVGDSIFQKKCLGKMQDATKSGRTVIFVSHHMESIASLCQKVLLLEQGKLLKYGRSNEVIDYYLNNNSKVSTALLRDVVDRVGDGRLRFTESWIEDDNGNRLSTLRAGQYCKFVVIYETLPAASVYGLNVAILVTAANSIRAVDFNNRITGDDFDFKVPRSGRVECIIPRLPFNCGSYCYGVFARSQGGLEDGIRHAGNFEVAGGDFFHTGKLPDKDWMFLADHRWKLLDNCDFQSPEPPIG
jgi:lipopolysaccharide transport system ATP-binding protein